MRKRLCIDARSEAGGMRAIVHADVTKILGKALLHALAHIRRQGLPAALTGPQTGFETRANVPRASRRCFRAHGLVFHIGTAANASSFIRLRLFAVSVFFRFFLRCFFDLTFITFPLDQPCPRPGLYADRCTISSASQDAHFRCTCSSSVSQAAHFRCTTGGLLSPG